MKVRCITWSSQTYARERLQGVINFHQKLGHDIGFTNFEAPDLEAPDLEDQLRGCDYAYIWNGSLWKAKEIADLVSKKGIPHCFVEHAWFPQTDYLYFDPKGTNGNSSLFTDSLTWLNDDDYKKLDEERLKIFFKSSHFKKTSDRVLVPLQLPEDSQIRLWSPFQCMRSFITHTRKQFPDTNLLFRRHPKDEESYDDLGVPDVPEESLEQAISESKLVYGINSTVLLEAALAGKDVIAVGKSLLTIGKNRRQALAALLARQVPVDCDDLTPWMRRGRGLDNLRPLL